MIVRKNGHFEINSLYPNTDWYDEDNYVVDETKPENQELIQKIKNHGPYIKLVVEHGKLLDVIPLPKPEPEPVIPEPTTEEILLLALLEIAELKSKVAELEGDN